MLTGHFDGKGVAPGRGGRHLTRARRRADRLSPRREAGARNSLITKITFQSGPASVARYPRAPLYGRALHNQRRRAAQINDTSRIVSAPASPGRPDGRTDIGNLFAKHMVQLRDKIRSTIAQEQPARREDGAGASNRFYDPSGVADGNRMSITKVSGRRTGFGYRRGGRAHSHGPSAAPAR